MAESARSDRCLSLLERQRAAIRRDRGLEVRKITRRLGRAASTISRELRRHPRPHDRGIYDGDLAHARARERLRRPRRPLPAREPELRQIVQDELEEEWSPTRIMAHLHQTFPDRPEWHLYHEAIHQAIYGGGKGGLSRASSKKLRTGRPLRRRRRCPVARTPRSIAPSRLIHARPAVVEHLTRIENREGDLIVGGASRSAIGTLVDRRTGYLRPVHLSDGHSAEQLRVAMLPVLAGLPALVRQTSTWDQGSGMACHHLLDEHVADRHLLRPRPPARGCAARTRTPTACSASTSPSAATCAPSPTYGRLSTASTADRASGWPGAAQPAPWRPN